MGKKTDDRVFEKLAFRAADSFLRSHEISLARFYNVDFTVGRPFASEQRIIEVKCEYYGGVSDRCELWVVLWDNSDGYIKDESDEPLAYVASIGGEQWYAETPEKPVKHSRFRRRSQRALRPLVEAGEFSILQPSFSALITFHRYKEEPGCLIVSPRFTAAENEEEGSGKDGDKEWRTWFARSYHEFCEKLTAAQLFLAEHRGKVKLTRLTD